MGSDGSIRFVPIPPKSAVGAGTQRLHIPDSNCDPAPCEVHGGSVKSTRWIGSCFRLTQRREGERGDPGSELGIGMYPAS